MLARCDKILSEYLVVFGCGSGALVFGMSWNEIALVVFLTVLVTSWSAFQRLGEWLGVRIWFKRDPKDGA